MSRRPSSTKLRRSRLARRFGALEVLEPKCLITESLGIILAGLAVPTGLAAIVTATTDDTTGGEVVRSGGLPGLERGDAVASSPSGVVLEDLEAGGDVAGAARTAPVSDWLDFLHVVDAPDRPMTLEPPSGALETQGGGAANPSAGGMGPVTPVRGTVTPLRVPSPPGADALGASSPLIVSAGTGAAPNAAGTAAPAAAPVGTGSTGSRTASFGDGGADSGGLAAFDPGLISVSGTDTDVAMGAFENFPLYTLDQNQGVVLFPGQVHYATLAAPVDLRAQVRDTAVASYSWDTSGISSWATGITGTTTSRLQFTWTNANSNPAGNTASATLTVTNSLSQTEQQTYSFYIPYGSVLDSGSGGSGGSVTWPRALAPDLVRPGSLGFATHDASVAAVSGALEAAIVLPSYNPSLAPVSLRYDSLAADPRPVVVLHHTLDAALAVPTRVSGQLTFNGSALSTYYYDTSQFIPGDVMQAPFQADATALATGRYSYSIATGDVRGTTTTTTDTGTLTVVNEASSPFGAGWTLAGLNRVVAATGGVILVRGGGDSLWFGGSFASGGGTYSSPAGEFSALIQNADGTYTRTLTDGTRQYFDANGRQAASADRNDLRVTYAYDGAGKLTTIADPYAGVTTLAYDANGKLWTVADPANRVTTFTVTGGKLAGVQLPDLASTSYGYDAAGRMTRLTDPRSNALTVTYDGAGRVSGTTRPDLTTEAFTPYQVQGLGTSTSSASPGAATLMAEAVAAHTDPRGSVQGLRPDWRGMGMVNQATDADGHVGTAYRDANGLATVAIDRLNRATRYAYDSQGNVVTLTNPDGSVETSTYNGFSQVTAHTDARGKTANFTHDSEGNLTVVRDALLNRTTMTYTANGRVATVQDARNNVTSYAYDSQDRPTTITFPGGATSLIAYDAYGNAASVTDERGNVTATTYDARNRPTVAIDALLNRTTLSYDSGGNLTQVQAPLSRTTAYAYDAMDRLTTITAPLSRTTVVGYDAAGNRVTVKDPLDRVTTTTFDAQGRSTATTTPLVGASTRTTTVAYDAEGQVTRIADPLDRVTTITYNSRGWRSTVTDPLGNTATYTYSATGKLANRTDASSGGATQFNFAYDDLDRQVGNTDALNHTTTTVYDAVGNVAATVDANNNRTTLAYDSRNRLTTITDPLNHSTAYGYDAAGNRTSATDALGHATATAYDALNRATTITDARTGVTTTAYDGAGRRTGLTDPAGNRTTWSYDSADRLTTQTDALGTATSAYDAADQLVDRTDRAGRRTTFAYDAGGRRTAERWLDGAGGTVRTIGYTYDAVDQLTGIADPDATLSYTYDSGGLPLTARSSGGGAGQPDVTLASTYDAGGKRTGLADNLSVVGRTTYTYDAVHRLAQVDRTYGGVAGPRVAYGYDDADRTTSLSRTIGGVGTAVETALAYDAANRPTTLVHAKRIPGSSGGSDVVTPLATYAYSYDDAGRLASEANAEGAATYTYDDTNQLTGVGGSRSEGYGYDLNGNRNTTGYTTGAGNTLTAAPGSAFGFDAEGNQTSKTETATGKVTTYSYDHRDRLTGVTQKSSGGTVLMQATYTYDALNRRIGAEVDADGTGPGMPAQTWTVYDGQNPYADFDGSGTLQKRYLYGPAVDALLARTDSGATTAWYLVDKQGTVRDIADASGSLIDHVAYDSFGVASESSPANGDRFKFTGREYDATTGLYYYRARYYDPATGRFLGQDPLSFGGRDANLYRYVGNNPGNATDPSGTIGLGGESMLFDPSMTGDVASSAQQFGSDYANNLVGNANAVYNGAAQGVQGVINYVYTGEITPTPDVYSAAMAAAAGRYDELAPYAHAALSLLGQIPCAGVLANLTNSVLFDLERDGYPSLGTITDILSYVWNGGSCFAAGTPLRTPEGEKPIERFRPGDWVLAAPEGDAGAGVVARQVEKVFQTNAALVNLEVGGRTIRTTARHPFWVEGRGWTPASDLIEGDRLRSHDGRRIVVAGVRDAGETAVVYNLRVAEDHTYFVGARHWGFTVWAHNTCYRGDDRPPEAIFGADGEGPGFMPRGDNMDLQSHLLGNDNSGYVSTSTDQLAAAGFGSYVYTIDDQPNGIDVTDFNPSESEIAVPGGIPANSIQGAYQVNANAPTGPAPTGPFIPNPGYVRR